MKRSILLLGLAVAACSRGHVETTAAQPAGPLPRPSEVVVTDFTITPAQVHLDNGVGGTLRRQAKGQTDEQAVALAEQSAQQALADRLTERLAAYGLNVVRLPASTVPPPGTLLVQGQFMSVDQGNRTRRTLIGLGAGKSSVTAAAQVYYVSDPKSPQFLQSFQGSADSGHMPGAAATMGAGAAAQHVATSAALSIGTHALAEKYRTEDAANAVKLADALAQQIGGYAAQQGWVTAPP